MNDFASRAYLSLSRVSIPDRKLNFGFKLVTGLNLGIKIAYSRFKPNSSLRWPLNDCVATVNFPNMKYSFHLRRNTDYNVYMNPYFHEYDITSFIHSALKPGDIFIDAGAHAGSYTLQAALIAGSKGRVISIEPNPYNLRFLRLNVSLNHLENVDVIPKAVGETNQEVEMFYDQTDTALTSLDPTFLNSQRHTSFQTSLTTLDDIYHEYLDPSSIRVVKIDTEGNDLKVLSSARRTLSVSQNVIVEQNTDPVRQFMTQEGFGIHNMKPSGYLLATKRSSLS